MVDVQVGRGHGVVAHAAHTGTGRAFPILAKHGFDLVFLGVGKFETATGEEFDAIVRHRIVGRGNDRTHFDIEHGSQVGHAGSRNDAGVDHVEAAGAHARGQCRCEKIAGHSRITPHQRTAASFELAPTTVTAQHTHRGIAHIKRQLCGQVPVCQSSNAVGSEHTWHESQILAI